MNDYELSKSSTSRSSFAGAIEADLDHEVSGRPLDLGLPDADG